SYVYCNCSYYSTNGGSTWVQNSDYITNNYTWDWAIDSSRYGYRINSSGRQKIIERRNMISGTWSIAATVANASSSTDDRIDVVNRTMAVILDYQLFISTNGG